MRSQDEPHRSNETINQCDKKERELKAVHLFAYVSFPSISAFSPLTTSRAMAPADSPQTILKTLKTLSYPQ
jgi:hypothetical protein